MGEAAASNIRQDVIKTILGLVAQFVSSALAIHHADVAKVIELWRSAGAGHTEGKPCLC